MHCLQHSVSCSLLFLHCLLVLTRASSKHVEIKQQLWMQQPVAAHQ
jgi:hypothetical protein